MMIRVFLIHRTVLFGILMGFILTEMDLINMEDIMTIIMNIFQEKDGMKKIIAIKMNLKMNLRVIMILMKKKTMDLEKLIWRKFRMKKN